MSIALPKGTGYPPVYEQVDGTFIAASKRKLAARRDAEGVRG